MTPVADAGDPIPSATGARTFVRRAVVFVSCLCLLSLLWLGSRDASLEAGLAAPPCLVAGVLWWRRRGQGSAVFAGMLSLFVTLRYLLWRVATLAGASHPVPLWRSRSGLVLTGAWLLLAAELYLLATRFSGLFVVCWPLHRKPVPLPPETDSWPHVDVLIVAGNASEENLHTAMVAAMAIDWPADRLHLYLVSDGVRDDLCFRNGPYGVRVLTPSAAEATAPNILHAALTQTSSPLIAVLAAEDVPVRSFLQMTAGLLLANARLAYVQTPRYLQSWSALDSHPGPLTLLAVEQDRLRRAVQDGSDLWNANIVTASGTLFRRTAMEDVECSGTSLHPSERADLRSSLHLQRHGWRGAFVDIPQVAGPAPTSFRALVALQGRQTADTLQSLRSERFFLRGSFHLAQRICLLHRGLEVGAPLIRLLLYAAPVFVLLTGGALLPGTRAEWLAFGLPYLFLSFAADGVAYGRGATLLWRLGQQAATAPFLSLPVLRTLLRVQSPAHVTRVPARPRTAARPTLDGRPALTLLALLVVQAVALTFFALRRLSLLNTGTLPHLSLPGGLWVGVLWAAVDALLLLAALALTVQPVQRRRALRLRSTVRVSLEASGTTTAGTLADLSTGGARVQLAAGSPAQAGDAVWLHFPGNKEVGECPATVVRVTGSTLHMRFDSPDRAQREALVRLLFTRADRWLDAREHLIPLTQTASLARLLGSALQIPALALSGFSAHLSGRKAARALLLCLCLALTGFALHRSAAPHRAYAQTAARPPAAFSRQIPLTPRVTADGFFLQSLDLAPEEVVSSATLHLAWHAGPTAPSRLWLNGVRLRDFPAATDEQQGVWMTVSLPPELLVQHNRLSLVPFGSAGARCRQTPCTAQPLASATVEVRGLLLHGQRPSPAPAAAGGPPPQRAGSLSLPSGRRNMPWFSGIPGERAFEGLLSGLTATFLLWILRAAFVALLQERARQQLLGDR